MKRREFITLLGGAAVGWPLGARAQRPKLMRRVGVLETLGADDPEAQARNGAFAVQSGKMVHAALLLLMLEAVFTDLVSPSA